MTQTVAFLLSDLQNGGTEWFAVHLARAFKSRGHTPQILATRAFGDLLPLAEKEFGVQGLGGSGYCFGGVMRALPTLVRLLKNTPPDIIISGLPLVNALACLAVRLARIPTKVIVVEHVRTEAPTGRCALRYGLKTAMIKLTHRLAFRRVCVSQIVAQDLARLYSAGAPPFSIIANPIIPPDFLALCAQDVAHPWMAEKKEKPFPLIVSIGRLLDNKDYATMIEALVAVRAVEPRARLLILGEGEERSRLENLICVLGLQEAVSMPGAVPNVFPYLCAADLFVLASRSEAFGNVLVEALACGTAVVSTDCGGPREILQDGLYGRLVPIGDATALAKAMLAALQESLSNKETRMAYGRSFSVDRAVEAYLSLIKNSDSATSGDTAKEATDQ